MANDDEVSNLEEPESPFSSLSEYRKEIAVQLASRIVDESKDLDAFLQDQFWVLDGGQKQTLTSIDRDTLFSILSMLFAKVDSFHARMLMRVASELIVLSVDGEPDPNLPIVKAARDIVDTEPVEWLNSTPLVTKLNELLDRPDTL